jgi:pyroglutamyl-peptidase
VSRHVLLTGFEPFGPHLVNPTELLVRSLEGRIIGGCIVDARVFPVETRPLRDRLTKALHETRPQFVLGLGYAPGRAALAMERVAVNVLDFELPDASGATRSGEPIEDGGPDGRLATVPVREVVEAWAAGGVPGYVSDSAGTYLCNQWLYEALALGAASTPPVPAGFVHVPALPQQAVTMGADRTPSMALELMRRGVESAIETIARLLESRPAAPAIRPASTDWFPRGRRELER